MSTCGQFRRSKGPASSRKATPKRLTPKSREHFYETRSPNHPLPTSVNLCAMIASVSLGVYNFPGWGKARDAAATGVFSRSSSMLCAKGRLFARVDWFKRESADGLANGTRWGWGGGSGRSQEAETRG